MRRHTANPFCSCTTTTKRKAAPRTALRETAGNKITQCNYNKKRSECQCVMFAEQVDSSAPRTALNMKRVPMSFVSVPSAEMKSTKATIFTILTKKNGARNALTDVAVPPNSTRIKNMPTNRNKEIGNSFEEELCEILAKHGFWAHNMASKQAGQPADVIACRNKQGYLIDCKVCSTSAGFSLDRIEYNQDLAMTLWHDTGNGEGWFAFKISERDIYMLPHSTVTAYVYLKSYISVAEIIREGISLERWIAKCA